MASKVQQHQNAKDNLDGSTEMVFATCLQGIKPILFGNQTFENELHVKSAFKHSNELAQEVHEIRKILEVNEIRNLLNKFIGVLAWSPDSEVWMGEKCWF